MVFMHSSLVTVVSFILLRSPEMVLEGKKQMQEARLKTMYIYMIQKIGGKNILVFPLFLAFLTLGLPPL